ncbi:MAG: shikimate kinase [Oscillospiraceae bacterium]|jgi:shikimate dehydrogenase|nr:shikimate kinase [Oscillospiraceae bacterium]
MEFALLGEKLGHSFSPQIHRALAGCDYQLLPTPPEAVADLFRRRDFRGLNVTIPYKQTVMPLCDEIDPRAAAIGAVNTVVNRGGRLTGYNTDIDGLIYLARRTGVDMAGKKVVILGSGGTGRTARAAAGELGAAEIVTVSRGGEDNYETLSRHADAQVLLNTTPVGMYPNCGVSPVSLDAFPHLEGVLDVVYNPLRTALLLEARERGLPCSCGLPMLVAQAWRAEELFTGSAIPAETVEAVLAGLTAQLENVVLIGMPGCGKSTVGRALARRQGKAFLDLDRLIEERAGKSIPAIFAQEGEEAFRTLESWAVREAGARTGCVISTGGGVVTRAENCAPLRQNGVIIHLTRPLDRLPTAGRPVSQSTDLQTLWERRRGLYAAFADRTVDNGGPLEETLDTIEKELSAL